MDNQHRAEAPSSAGNPPIDQIAFGAMRRWEDTTRLINGIPYDQYTHRKYFPYVNRDKKR